MIHGDCREVIPTLGKVDAVVTDPPYGISIVGRDGKIGGSVAAANQVYRPVHGDDEPFDPRHLLGLAPIVCLWGANHYADRLPPRGGWLVWDKRDGLASNKFSDCELAWSSVGNSARLFGHRWMGMVKASEHGKRVHPTQKPVALMAWVLDVLGVPPGALVLDPYCGAGSTGVACVKSGRRFVGVEYEAHYCGVARRRIAEALPLWHKEAA